MDVLEALSSVGRGHVLRARAPRLGSDASLVPGVLRDLLEHGARARVRVDVRRLDPGARSITVEARGVGLLLAGQARVAGLGELCAGEAFVARMRHVELEASIPAWIAVAELRAPTWREWLTASYRAHALRNEDARRYALGRAAAVALPSLLDGQEGLRALAREWHEQRSVRGELLPANVSTEVTARSILQRRAGAVLRLARSERGIHLVYAARGPILSVPSAQEELLRFFLREERFQRESLPVTMADQLFVDLAGRLVASGAFVVA